MQRRSFLGILSAATVGASQANEVDLNRPKVPGTLRLLARRRGDHISERVLRWEVAQTAIIICDMWDRHTCRLSEQRVAAMAPRMNQVVSKARSLGVMIVHAPSDTMKFYEGTPWRQRMQRAPTAPSATPILARCGREPMEERNFPIDDTAGGCDDPVPKEDTGPPYPWTRENSAIDVVGFDGVSDNGQEIYNFFKQEAITNVALMGVHANICILNRSYGIRQLTRLGFHVVLVRDLTDSMYDPRKRPFVSHARGTELVVEHIETRWCPSVVSEDLTRVIVGSDRAKAWACGHERQVGDLPHTHQNPKHMMFEPTARAMYCFPSTMKVIGDVFMVAFRGSRHSGLPFRSSAAMRKPLGSP